MPKALLDLGGVSALDRVLTTAAGAELGPPIVVLGFGAERVVPLILARGKRPPRVRWIANPDPERGQTSSVQAGLAALPPAASAVALWPVDHPLIEIEDLRALVTTARARPECPVVLPSHMGRAGHPALLRRTLFPAILALAPETPLRDFLRTERARTAFVERPTDSVLVDLDTPADLEAARQRLRAEDGQA